VQQRRHQRLAVEVPVGQDLGDRERMRDVRVARLAGLAGVGGFEKRYASASRATSFGLR
jgi:hypothetical protein